MTRWKNGIDWPTTFWLSTVHLGAFAAPFCFTWSGFLVAVFLAWLTGGVGVALGYHRLLTHNSFQTSLTFRRVLAFLGQMSGEGTALMWVPVDVFCVYTDNETYAGSVHPSVALENYRQAMGIDAKLVVVGMTATEFTIADPNDPGMLDVAGFDADAPQAIAEFAR